MEITNSNASVQGMMKAFDTNAARAKRLANPETDPTFEKDMAELPQDKEMASVNLTAIKVKDQMLGDLLDIVA